MWKIGWIILMAATGLVAEAKEESRAVSINKVIRSEAEWKQQLSAIQYRVTRKKDTERRFSGVYWDHKALGIYSCICCGTDLFLSDTKFESGCGWPSYFQPISDEGVTEQQDRSHGMVRTEVICSKCDAHLGHVFSDGPPPTGLRYCINSAALNFRKTSELVAEKSEEK